MQRQISKRKLFYCGHACELSGCSTRSGNLLWDRFSTIKIHIKGKQHRSCTNLCPGWHRVDDFLIKQFIEGKSEPTGLKDWMSGSTPGQNNSNFHAARPSHFAALLPEAGPSNNLRTSPHYRESTYQYSRAPTPTRSSIPDLEPDSEVNWAPTERMERTEPNFETRRRAEYFRGPPVESSLAPEVIKVLFIPDPTRSVGANARNDSAVLKVNMKDMDVSGNIPDYAIKKIGNSHWTQEWVWMLAQNSPLQKAQTNVTMMNYQEYMNHLLCEDGNMFSLWLEDLKEFNVLIGIPDKSLDYFNSDYELSDLNIDLYNRNLGVLRSSIVIWPDPTQVDVFGRKDILIKNLDQISHTMRTHRPATIFLERGAPIPEGTVLKRTHSDSGHHVLLPNNPIRTWDNMDQGPPGTVWMSQEYVPELQEVGEWRAIIVNQAIQYVIHTVPKNGVLSSRIVNGFYSLKELSEIQRANGNLGQLDFSNPEGSSKQSRDDAKNEFKRFVMEVFDRLKQKEVDETSAATLDIFCRMDISLIFDGDKRAHYFVNEVERTNTASLWTTLKKTGNVTMANDFSLALADWTKKKWSNRNE